jgi:hypothetical protein
MSNDEVLIWGVCCDSREEVPMEWYMFREAI